MKNDIEKIAIVRLSALGDIINSAVVLQFIHKEFPNVKIEWVTEEMFASVLKSHPLLDAVHTLNLKKFKKEKKLSLLLQTIKEVRSLGEYQKIIDIQGLIKSALVSWFMGKENHGFDKNSTRESLASLFYKTKSSIAYEQNVVKRNCFVVSDALGFEINESMILNKEKIFPITEKFTLPKTKKNVLFVIGASWKSKIYPKELVAQVCDALEENSYIIWGSDEEKKDAEWIVKNSSAIIAPKMNLKTLISYISHMDLLIGNDTGPTHMAWAQNIPSITLFGPTNERMIYETPKNIAIQSPSKVNILKIDKNDFSIKEIRPQEITTKAKELLYGI